MSVRRGAWTVPLLFGLVVAPLLFPLTARAEDPAPVDEKLEKVKALEASAAEHGAANAEAALCEDAKAAAALYKECEGKEPYRTRIVKVLGALTRERSDTVQKSGLEAIADTGDEDAGKYAKPFLKPVQEGAVPPLLSVAIQTAAKAPDETLIDPLFKVLEDSKNAAVAAEAMEALGAFGRHKRRRARLLEDLVKCVQRVQPGGKGQAGKDNQTNPEAGVGNKQGDGAQARWTTLSPVLPKTLNQLTGQSFTSTEDWFAVVKEHKRDLGALFKSKD
jgi:hypothetical protein